MKVAILYNPRPAELPPDAPDDAFEEFDGPETIAAIAAALRGLGVEPIPIEAGPEFPARLRDKAVEFAFNIAEGTGGRCREAIPAAVCEFLGVPYSGSDPLTLAVTLDKYIGRRIVSPDVPVARAVLVENLDDEARFPELSFPVVVKPNDEGSSKGIRPRSFCIDASEAGRQSRHLRERYDCRVLVEEFLPGAEVTAGVLGNGAGTRILGMMEIAPASMSAEPFLYCVETKRDYLRQVRYHVPPRLPAAELRAMETYALAAYRLLGCRDFARIDFRLDAAGQPRFLECNPLPGLNPVSSDLVILSRDVLPYDRLVQEIFLAAAGRVKLNHQEKPPWPISNTPHLTTS